MNAKLRPVPATRPRAVLYLRQSVARDDSISLELQEIAGRDYCERMGYDVVRVEVDEGISGRTWARRPAVQRVMDMIEQRDAEVIVLWKWSRLSRSRKDWAIAADRVDIAGGRIESATEPIDTATASGRFARGVMTEYAAFQSEQIGEQWEEVRRRRFNLGLPPSGKLPWGWSKGDPHPVISDENAAIIRQMYQLYFEGRGLHFIANWMMKQGIPAPRGGEWRIQTVMSFLNSPIHAGYVSYRGEIRNGQHEGVITDAEWERYKITRDSRKGSARPRETLHLLSTLVRCHCGFKRSGTKGKSRWADGRKVYYSYICPSSKPHPAKSLITWKVDAAVVRWLQAIALEGDESSSPVPRADIERIARDIIAVDRRLDALTAHLVDGLVPRDSYTRSRDALVLEGDKLRAALAEAEQAGKVAPGDFLGSIRDSMQEWELLSIPNKQAVVRSVIREITVLPDNRIAIQPMWRTSDPDVVATDPAAVG